MPPNFSLPYPFLRSLSSVGRVLAKDDALRWRPAFDTGGTAEPLPIIAATTGVACHHGLNVGGNLFQKFGVFPDLVGPIRPDMQPDPGCYCVTGVARDRGVFRVPSLRNVALTAPYFHDGRATTLEDAVDTMGRVQLGRTLTHEEIRLIVQFLRTLTGDYQGRSMADPAEEPRQ
jgi:cytochrome c peroxidase